ncbi:hypothetical protein HGRIS_000208 [Hohenbuehelia grisea]|uniref:Magnesium transporter n=1 Tax=Hohenbuehelia grisea TaxID=104357 RepID=A0ABR3JQH8_9AGAR
MQTRLANPRYHHVMAFLGRPAYGPWTRNLPSAASHLHTTGSSRVTRPACSIQANYGRITSRTMALSSPWTCYTKSKCPSLWPFSPVRQMSWATRLISRPITVNHNTPSDTEEEVAKAAILEKVMKGRQPTDLMLRCTILDAEGNVKTISGQFKKSDLCAEHRLHPRDLRKIDSRVPNLVPTILVRKEAILVNILHIRALVKSDTVVLFDTFGSADSRLHSVFLYHLEHNLKAKGSGLPYEFRALESVLLSVLSALEAEMVFIRNLVGGLLAELEDNIDHDRFKRLLHYSRRLASFQNRAKLVSARVWSMGKLDFNVFRLKKRWRKSSSRVCRLFLPCLS